LRRPSAQLISQTVLSVQTLTNCFNGRLFGWTWLGRYQNVSILDFIGAKEVLVTTGAVKSAKLQSNCRHQKTNTQRFTGRMLFLSPSQQCQSMHSEDLLTPSAHGGLQTLSLTTKLKAHG